MSYTEPFVSQLHWDGTGWNDCFQAALAAYLKAAGKLPMSITDTAALQAVSLASRGTLDDPSNPYTTLAQADIGLAHYGLPVQLTYAYTAALAAPWSICLVDGTAITKADGSKPYPASWFNYEIGPDHFCLWGPSVGGASNWIMNPLDPARVWAQYDLNSWQRAWSCAYTLPATSGQWVTRVAHWKALRAFGLLHSPVHGSTAVSVVPKDGTGLTWGERHTTAGEVWERCQWRDRVGWVPLAYLTTP